MEIRGSNPLGGTPVRSPASAVERRKRHARLISAGQLSLKHLTEVAERILAIEETLRAQDDQLLRMEKAILPFEVDRSVHRTVDKARAAATPAASPAK